jgi:hypothetical protein
MQESDKTRIDELQKKYRKELLERIKEINPRLTAEIAINISSDGKEPDFRDVEKFRDKFWKEKPFEREYPTHEDMTR